MKEVQKYGSQFVLNILEMLEKGYNPSKICIQLNIKKQKLQYYLSSLKRNGNIEKIGYGVWKVKSKEVQMLNLTSSSSQQVQNIRGHAFIWKVRFKQTFNWKELLHSKQINYDEVGIYDTPRILLNGQKIWLGKNNVVFYDKDSYYAKTSSDSIKLAISRLLESISKLEEYFGITLNNYVFTCSRQHYSLIQNALAIQCDKEGKSINIRNDRGYWMSIDNSLNLHEAEAIHTESSPLDVEGIKKYFNSHKATNFKVTPEFVLGSINQVTENQIMFAKNIESHIEAIKGISSSQIKLRNAIDELTNIIKELKK